MNVCLPARRAALANTRQRRGLLPECRRCRKITFYTRGDAERFIRHNRGDMDPVGVVAYPCPIEPGYHVGHSNDGLPFVDQSNLSPS